MAAIDLFNAVSRRVPLRFHNRAFFWLYRWAQYRTYRPIACDDPWMEELEDRGFVVVPDFLELESQPELGNWTHSFTDWGIYKRLGVEGHPEFFDHPRLWSLARGYVSEDVSLYQRMLELRNGVGLLSVADVPHFDHWRHRLKAFLYLTDVGPENAPFVYFPGTHKAPWREQRQFEMFRYGQSGTYGHYFLHEVEHLERVACTGKAGTLILADTRGLHSGTVLQDGQRLMLAAFFG